LPRHHLIIPGSVGSRRTKDGCPLLDGHAFAAVWLVKRTLPKTVEKDVIEIRKAIAAGELIVFETTGVTHRPAMTFEQAKKAGAKASTPIGGALPHPECYWTTSRR
jgi:hypothetical protein